MAVENSVFALTRRINNKWLDYSYASDRGCDLRDLDVVVGTGVAGTRDQSVERPVLDRIGESRRHVVCVGAVPRRVVTGFGYHAGGYQGGQAK